MKKQWSTGGLSCIQPAHNSILNQKVEIIDDSVLVVIGQDELYEDTILVSAMNPEQVRVELSKNWKEQELFVNKIVRQILEEGRRYSGAHFGVAAEKTYRS